MYTCEHRCHRVQKLSDSGVGVTGSYELSDVQEQCVLVITVIYFAPLPILIQALTV